MRRRRITRDLRILGQKLSRAVWVPPSIAMIGGTVTAALTATSDVTLPRIMGGLMTTSGAVGARDLVQTVASTSLTVATFVFSVTIVALQVAASQYSPRVPQQFIRDRGTQIVMSLFIFSFVYSLATLRTIRADADIVPTLAVSIAFGLALITVGGFVYFIGHIVKAMRVEQILRTLERTTLRALRRTLVHQLPDDGGFPGVLPDMWTIPARRDGVVEMLYERDLRDLAVREGVGLEVLVKTGDQAVEGTPIARVWPVGHARAPDVVRLAEGVDDAVRIGPYRLISHDPIFGLTQIVDIALRASSPAVNDPTTTRNAIRSAEIVLCEFASCVIGRRTIRDGAGKARLVVPALDFDGCLDLVVTPIRSVASSDLSVVLRLMRMLSQLAWVAQDPAIIRCLQDHTDGLADHADEGVTLDRDRARVAGEIDALRAHLHRRARMLQPKRAAA